jgi:hypothetical protein
MDFAEQHRRTLDLVTIWSERVEIARRQNQEEMVAAAQYVVSTYEKLQSGMAEPAFLAPVNVLRKRIESSEQHRTMCVEHGLSDAAIDATYEIQQMEKELIELVRAHQASA